ncbi:MAG TPA: tripartite tricarboxylate transporter substrate-binding protein [Vineibacter sp.]|nr:tripartite tricarboxylate transporter substrate-binding protein [Vineibacter sp.]
MRRNAETVSSYVRRRDLLAGVAAGVVAMPWVARAQGFPKDRVTIVTSLPAGSSVDVTTRIVAEKLSQMWRQPIVVDNRGGANGLIACELVARARPDGLTLLATSAMTHAANPALYDKLPYDPVADFVPVMRLGMSPFILMSSKALPPTSLVELVAFLKTEPGRHHFGAGSLPARIASEMFRQQAGVDIVHVGYKGNQQAFPDLTEGRISLMTVDVVGAKPLVDRDAVRALAVTYAARYPTVPSVPTSAEAGMPGFELTTWSGIYAPRATPPELVEQIARDAAAALEAPDVKARLDALGGGPREVALTDAFGRFTRSEIDRWGKIIRSAGLKVE